MRFVEHRHVHGRQQLCHAGVAQRQVGEEEVVVDHHQVGRHRLAAGLHHVAAAVFRAFAAEAVLARRGHQRDHRRALVQAFELGQVAAHGALRPLLDLRQRARRIAVGQRRRLPGQHQPLQAQVAAASLQQGHADRQGQHLAQPRQIAQEKLVLQALGRGADQRAMPGQQRRDQVGERLADACAGLGHQHLARIDRIGHGCGELQLGAALAVLRISPLQRTAERECRTHRLLQFAAHAVGRAHERPALTAAGRSRSPAGMSPAFGRPCIDLMPARAG
ncbi:hypothetical protein X551_01635 [Methylibium sp. T29]|nr:hypothetical protein X551_01635 [Methylibium sp. T29]